MLKVNWFSKISATVGQFKNFLTLLEWCYSAKFTTMSIFDNLILSIFQKLFYSTCDRENFLSFIPNFKNFHLLLEQLLSKLGLLLDWLCIVEIFPSIVKILTLENIILLNPFMIFLEQSNITQTKVKQKYYA